MASTFSLNMDKSSLQSAANKLQKIDDDGRDIEKALNNLSNVILNDIQSDNLGQLLDKLDKLRERELANGNDNDVNSALNCIHNEIDTIQAAINAQKEAARILSTRGGI